MARKVIYSETLRHREAFDYYYSLGSIRSFDKVSRQFSVSSVSISNWSRSFDWPSRVRATDIELATRLDIATKEVILDQRKRITSIVEKLIDDCVRVSPDGEITLTFLVENVQDFERVVRMYLLLAGEPTDRSEVITNDPRQLIIARINQILAISG